MLLPSSATQVGPQRTTPPGRREMLETRMRRHLNAARGSRTRERKDVAREEARRPTALLLGPYPPPYGGVSSHLKRWHAYLASNGWRVTGLTRYRGYMGALAAGSLRKNPVAYAIGAVVHSADIVHYHYSDAGSFAAVALVARWRPAKFVITVHGNDFCASLGRSGLRARFLTSCLNRFDACVAVTPEIADCLRRYASSPIRVIPAFMPPS